MTVLTMTLTQEQSRRLKSFSESTYGLQGWYTTRDERGLGKTTLLRAMALVEAQDKPVTVFVPNDVCAREFLMRMPKEILESAQMKQQNTLLEYGEGIHVLPCTNFEKLLGCQRECILVDDADMIDLKILDFHIARAHKMFICS